MMPLLDPWNFHSALHVYCNVCGDAESLHVHERETSLANVDIFGTQRVCSPVDLFVRSRDVCLRTSGRRRRPMIYLAVAGIWESLAGSVSGYVCGYAAVCSLAAATSARTPPLERQPAQRPLWQIAKPTLLRPPLVRT